MRLSRQIQSRILAAPILNHARSFSSSSTNPAPNTSTPSPTTPSTTPSIIPRAFEPGPDLISKINSIQKLKELGAATIDAIKKGDFDLAKSYLATISTIANTPNEFLIKSVKLQHIQIIHDLALKSAASTGNSSFFKSVIGYCKGYASGLNTCFMEAVRSSNLEVVDLLLDMGIGPKEDSKYSALDLASELNALPLVKKLIKNKFTFNDSTIVAAVVKDNLPLVKLLLEAELRLRNWTHDGIHKNLQTHAALNGRLEILKYLLECNGEISAGILVEAASHGHIDMVKFLVANGCDHRESSYQAFYCAIKEKNVDMIRYLISLGITCAGHKSALFRHACKSGLTEIIGDFMKLGVKIDTYVRAVAEAIEKDNHDMISFFIKNDSSEYYNARHMLVEYSIQKGWVSSVSSFMLKGAIIPKTFSNGKEVLAWTITDGSPAMAEYLINSCRIESISKLSLDALLNSGDKNLFTAFMVKDGSKEILANLSLDDMASNGWLEMLKNVFPMKFHNMNEIDSLIRLADVSESSNKGFVIEYLVAQRDRLREIRNSVFTEQITNVGLAGIGIAMVYLACENYVHSYLV